MVELSEWGYETTVVDPEYYAIECPVQSNGMVICPHATCRYHIDYENQIDDATLTAFIRHASQVHQVTYGVAVPCRNEDCDTTMVQARHDEREYCSRDCYNECRGDDPDSRAGLRRQIRDCIDADHHQGYYDFTKAELRAILDGVDEQTVNESTTNRSMETVES